MWRRAEEQLGIPEKPQGVSLPLFPSTYSLPSSITLLLP